MLKMNEIENWDSKLIGDKIDSLRRELFDFNMQKATSRLEKPHMIRVLKKDIARLLTVKNLKSEK